MTECKSKTIGTVASDMTCAAHLLRAAGICALENVYINISLLKDQAAADRLEGEARAVRDSLAS